MENRMCISFSTEKYWVTVLQSMPWCFIWGKIQSLSRTVFIMEVQTSCQSGEAQLILSSPFSKTWVRTSLILAWLRAAVWQSHFQYLGSKLPIIIENGCRCNWSEIFRSFHRWREMEKSREFRKSRIFTAVQSLNMCYWISCTPGFLQASKQPLGSKAMQGVHCSCGILISHWRSDLEKKHWKRKLQQCRALTLSEKRCWKVWIQ